jgi:hypothetical protein
MQLCRPYLYVVLALCVPVLALFHTFTRVEIVTESWWPVTVFLMKLVPFLWLLFVLERKLGRCPMWLMALKSLTEATLLVFVVVTVLRLLDHTTTTLVLPLVDVQLAAIDEAFGWSWLTYLDWIHRHPDWHGILSKCYSSIEAATFVIVVILFALKQGGRAKAMIEAFVVCAVISIFFGMLFPARGAAHFWVADFASFPNFVFPPGMYAVEQFDALRDMTGTVVVGDGPMGGLVTFPSLHMATGVLFMLAAMRTWAWVPVWVFSGLMIAATPVWGGHYFIDLVAGAVLAIMVWKLVRRSMTTQTRKTPIAGAVLPEIVAAE